MTTWHQEERTSKSYDRLRKWKLEARKSDESPELRQLERNDNRVEKTFEALRNIYGMESHTGKHAAAAVVTPDQLTDHLPTQRDDDEIITQFDGDQLEELGLLKIDVLGLKTLRTIRIANDIVEEETGQRVPQETLESRDDPKVYEEIFGKGDTAGIFQFKSGGMKRFLDRMEPWKFTHIAAMNALYRPGPMQNIPDFIDRMHGEKDIIYIHESIHDAIKDKVDDILDDTYGIMVFQEQVMKVCQRLAGFSLGDADIMRRAIGKKKEKLLMKQKQKFIKGCMDEGYDRSLGETIFDQIEEFAQYAFNRCMTKDTKVVDASSGKRIPIGDIVEGREEDVSVFALDESTQELVESEVTDAFKSGERMTYRLETRTGRSIQVTANHPFYTQDGWKNLKDLSDDDRIAIPRELDLFANDDLKDHELVVLAYAIAEGEVSRSTGFFIYSSDQDVRVDFGEHVRYFSNTTTTTDHSRSSAPSVYVKRRKRNRISGANKMINDLGLRGCTATEKFVPGEVFTCSDESIALFLGRLWTGDGCVTIEDTYYATSSYELAEDVQHLLLRLGIKSKLHEKTFKYRGGTRDGFTVRITTKDMARFADVIGPYLVGNRKEDLSSIEEADNLSGGGRSTQDIIPQSVHPVMRSAVVDDAEENDTTIKATMKKAGVSPSLIRPSVGKRECRKGFGRSTVRSIAEATDNDELRKWSDSDIYWDEIESITKCEVEEVYDLTVAGHHNFVAEDIVVHNSHSTAYAAIAYQQAYFKAKYPTAFFTAALRTEDNEDDQVDLIQDAESHGVDVLPPSVNESGQQFTAIPGKKEIRFGLGTIKHVGQEAQKIIDERQENGPYQSLMDLALRAIPNLGAVKSLIKAGAMDDFGLSRKAMYEQKDEIFSYARKMRDYRTGDRVTEPEAPDTQDKPEWPAKMRFQQERDVAGGIYTTGKPTDRFPGLVEAFDGQTYRRTRRGKQDKDYMLRCGSILSIDEATTSTDKPMWWIRYLTQNGIYEEPTFEWRFKHIKYKLEKDVPLAIVGEADATGEFAGMWSIRDVIPLEEVETKMSRLARPSARSVLSGALEPTHRSRNNEVPQAL